MSRILLVDDSPHAQRMGERILSDEGYEVVTVSNADSALIRVEDVDPDVVLADTVMPGRTGYDICQYLKMNPRHKHVRVILTAGVLEPIDTVQAARVEADGTINKPFEASVLIAAVKPLADAAAQDRAAGNNNGATGPGLTAGKAPAAAFVAVVDAEQVRAAVTVALDAAMSTMVDAIAGRVLTALQTKKSEPPALQPEEPAPSPRPAAPESSAPESAPARVQAVRRVNPMRMRSSSILGSDVRPQEPLSTPLPPLHFEMDRSEPEIAPQPVAQPPAADPGPSAPGPQ